MKVILVCGGRDYGGRDLIRSVLDSYKRAYRHVIVIQGGANGADAWAREWADDCGVSSVTYRAAWKAHGKSAGPQRNAAMLAHGRPDVVAAFPGGEGTADMIARARAAGVKVDEWPTPEARVMLRPIALPEPPA